MAQSKKFLAETTPKADILNSLCIEIHWLRRIPAVPRPFTSCDAFSCTWVIELHAEELENNMATLMIIRTQRGSRRSILSSSLSFEEQVWDFFPWQGGLTFPELERAVIREALLCRVATILDLTQETSGLFSFCIGGKRLARWSKGRHLFVSLFYSLLVAITI